MIVNTPYQIVTTQAALEECLARLPDQGMVGLDTEFLRRDTYFPQLCVMQLAIDGDIFLIDALAEGLDLAPLFAWLVETECVLVLHAPLQDLQIIYLACNALPRHVFDTQIAAAFLGHPMQVSLADLLQNMLEVELDKTHQLANWHQRPLDEAIWHYAAQDVAHLVLLAQKLQQMLAEKGRSQWAAEDTQPFLEASHYQPNIAEEWQRWQPKGNAVYNQAVYRLLVARQEMAEAHDMPRNWVISTADIAVAAEKHTSGVAVPYRQFTRRRNVINQLQAVLESNTPIIVPDYVETLPPSPDKKDVKRAKQLLQAQAAQYDVPPEMVATTRQLQQLVVAKMQGQPPEGKMMQGWRHEVFGQAWLALLARSQ